MRKRAKSWRRRKKKDMEEDDDEGGGGTEMVATNIGSIGVQRTRDLLHSC